MQRAALIREQSADIGPQWDALARHAAIAMARGRSMCSSPVD
jgi:hypothetical protein